jgi:hypothetical protein
MIDNNLIHLLKCKLHLLTANQYYIVYYSIKNYYMIKTPRIYLLEKPTELTSTVITGVFNDDWRSISLYTPNVWLGVNLQPTLYTREIKREYCNVEGTKKRKRV